MWKPSSLARLLIYLAVAAAMPQTGKTQTVQAKHSRVELLSRHSTIGAGTELLLGIHFVLEPGWHIYWVNPGDSGQPPAFKWQLPPGFSAGEIQWPRPERMQSSPQLADYGYHGETLLIVPVHIPPQWPGPDAEIGVEAKWLICREVCLPDRAQLHLSLPAVSPGGARQNSASLFAKAMNMVPKPLPPGWKASAISRKDDFVLSVEIPAHTVHAEFFPLVSAQLDNAARQIIEPAAHGVKIVLRKSELLVKPVTVLRGVLVFGEDCYQIEAPVSAGKE
jgi:thiol:disulfide interchange protein DsbD